MLDDGEQSKVVGALNSRRLGLDQIAIGMNNINLAVRQSAAGTQQSQKAAQDMNDLAGQLKQVTAQYRL